MVSTLPALAVDPWPAEPNDFHEDLSGSFSKPKQHRLWLCRNGGATGSKFWAVVPHLGGSCEVEDLMSTPIAGGSARQLRTVRTFTGPHHRNNEGLTLALIDECSGGFRNAFLTTDGGGYESLTWFKSYAEGCTTLSVSKDTASGTVEFSWSRGVWPFTIVRAEDPLVIGGRTALLDEAPVTTLADSVLPDGSGYFYLVP